MSDGWTAPDGVPANAAGLMRLDRLVSGARRAVETTVLVRSGVSWGGYLLLSAAATADRLSYRDLADVSRVAAATVPHLVDTLHRARLLSRTRETGQPGGRILVTLTHAGRTQLAAVHALVEPVADTLLRGLADLLSVAGPPGEADTPVRGIRLVAGSGGQ